MTNDSKRDELAREFMNKYYELYWQNEGREIDPVFSGYCTGYDAARASRDEEITKLVEALEFECGNRCAEQNPCNAKEALKLYRGEK